MDDLAVFFSGEHALRRNVKNEDLMRYLCLVFESLWVFCWLFLSGGSVVSVVVAAVVDDSHGCLFARSCASSSKLCRKSRNGRIFACLCLCLLLLCLVAVFCLRYSAIPFTLFFLLLLFIYFCSCNCQG